MLTQAHTKSAATEICRFNLPFSLFVLIYSHESGILISVILLNNIQMFILFLCNKVCEVTVAIELVEVIVLYYFNYIIHILYETDFV